MLDFQRNITRRQDIRRQRRHLSLLILGLGVVFLLAGWIASPSLWRWLDSLAASNAKTHGTAIDNRLEDLPGRKTKGENDFWVSTVGTAVGETTPRPPDRQTADPFEIPREEFGSLRDDKPSSREEQSISMRLLGILKHADIQTLRQRSIGAVSYAQLFQQPDDYRGRLVSQSGIVRRANWLRLPRNEHEIEGYYQVWLWPFDNSISPIIVYCLELPRGFPTGMNLAEQVQVTGFFLKRCAYSAADTIRVAPEILAKTVEWDQRVEKSAREPAETWPIAVVVCAAVVVSLLVAAVVYYRTRPSHPVLPENSPDFDSLHAAEEKEDATDERE